jgi:hypothetical protein
MKISQQAREIVNEYEDHCKHLRGYYCRTDLLAIVKKALFMADPAKPEHWTMM